MNIIVATISYKEEVQNKPILDMCIYWEPSFIITFFDDDHSQNTKVGVYNTSSDGFSTTLSSASGAEAGMSFAEKQSHTDVGKNSLFHGKSLFVIASSNS